MIQSSSLAEEFKQYAYSVSHDVSAPVRAMVEFSRLLEAESSGILSGDAHEYLALIIENGKKLQAMMDGLLRYSRVNTHTRSFIQVDLNTVLETARNELRQLVDSSQASITMDLLPIVYADPDQVQLLMYEMLKNALLYQVPDNRPVVHISARRKQSHWGIDIADNGIGIAPKYRELIFQPFKRLHTDEEYPGVGMGLAIAKKIADRHGGGILCATNAAAGSVFTVLLQSVE